MKKGNRMKRILAIAAIAASGLGSVPLTGQKATAVARVGLLSDYEKFGGSASPSDWLASFRAGLRELGYVEGKNVVLEFRYANRDPEKLARMAAELAAMNVNVIVAASTTAAKAAKAVTHAIPIVFWGAEPVSSGLVANLDHPGENLTGVTFNEEAQKEFLAQLKEVLPRLNRVGILFNRGYAPVPGILKYAESGARELGLSPQLVEVAAPSDLPGAFATMKREGSRAVLVLNHPMFFEDRAALAALAITNGIAVSTPYQPSAEAGALIAHEADFDKVWRLNASYVAKILKGANPGDLSVLRLAAFRYAINLNTAKALGLRIPASMSDRAERVSCLRPRKRDRYRRSSDLGGPR
jgi:putative ABC transport system substrate-binding protein